jgi:hypothetical protein
VLGGAERNGEPEEGTRRLNQSVGAFLGAFTAYVLFVLNDCRRDRRKAKSINAEVAMNVELAKSKLETVRRKRSQLRDENSLNIVPLLGFNTTLIRQFCAEAHDQFRPDHRRAIEAVCYAMEATDESIRDAHALEARLGDGEEQNRNRLVERLMNDYDDAVANLRRVIEVGEDFIARRYSRILTKHYDRTDYLDRP